MGANQRRREPEKSWNGVNWDKKCKKFEMLVSFYSKSQWIKNSKHPQNILKDFQSVKRRPHRSMTICLIFRIYIHGGIISFQKKNGPTQIYWDTFFVDRNKHLKVYLLTKQFHKPPNFPGLYSLGSSVSLETSLPESGSHQNSSRLCQPKRIPIAKDLWIGSW